MLLGALFTIMEEAGEGVLVMTEDVEKDAFLRSRLTRHEVQRRLLIMARSAVSVGPGARRRMPELSWEGWERVARELDRINPEADELLWFAASALAPATLMWIEVARNSQPELFALVP